MSTMIWIKGFPLPPSVNTYLQPVAGGWSRNKKGKVYRKGHLVKTKIHTDFMDRCYLWKQKNLKAFSEIISILDRSRKEAEAEGVPFALKVDCFFAFERSRVFTLKGNPKALDDDNRVKPLRDALSKLLGLDDKHFFSGQSEKVTTASKEFECSVIRISRINPRTLDQVLSQIKKETQAIS